MSGPTQEAETESSGVPVPLPGVPVPPVSRLTSGESSQLSWGSSILRQRPALLTEGPAPTVFYPEDDLSVRGSSLFEISMPIFLCLVSF